MYVPWDRDNHAKKQTSAQGELTVHKRDTIQVVCMYVCRDRVAKFLEAVFDLVHLRLNTMPQEHGSMQKTLNVFQDHQPRQFLFDQLEDAIEGRACCPCAVSNARREGASAALCIAATPPAHNHQ